MGLPPDRLALIVWRISNYEDISGRGGLIVSGRWHTYPRPVMYCSDEPYTAYCEVLKHFGSEYLFPDAYKVLEIAAPKRVKADVLPLDELSENWSADTPEALLGCRRLGDRWLAEGRSALLKVPSAARPGSHNYLLNPVHRDADDFRIVRVIPMPFPDWVKVPLQPED